MNIIIVCLLFIQLVQSLGLQQTKNPNSYQQIFERSKKRIFSQSKKQNMKITNKNNQLMNINQTFIQFIDFEYKKRLTANIINKRLDGFWIYIVGTKEYLSCNILLQTISKNIMLFKYSNNDGKIETKTMDSSIINKQLNIYQIAQQIKKFIVPNLECNMIKYKNNITFVSQNTLFQKQVKLNIQGNITIYTQDFQLILADQKLYRVNDNLDQYKSIYTFQKFQRYYLVHKDQKIILCGYNKTINQESSNQYPKFIYQLKFVIFTLNKQFKQIGLISEQLQTPSKNLIFNISPQMTLFTIMYEDMARIYYIKQKWTINYEKHYFTKLNSKDELMVY